MISVKEIKQTQETLVRMKEHLDKENRQNYIDNWDSLHEDIFETLDKKVREYISDNCNSIEGHIFYNPGDNVEFASIDRDKIAEVLEPLGYKVALYCRNGTNTTPNTSIEISWRLE